MRDSPWSRWLGDVYSRQMKGELTQELNPLITCKVEDGAISFERANEEKHSKALHGLYRSLVKNMVEGVSQGYTIKQELVGVGSVAYIHLTLPTNRIWTMTVSFVAC